MYLENFNGIIFISEPISVIAAAYIVPLHVPGNVKHFLFPNETPTITMHYKLQALEAIFLLFNNLIKIIKNLFSIDR